MAQTHKDRREAYDKRTYKEYKLRVRRDSALFRKIENHKRGGGSINGLLVGLLENCFALHAD